MLPVAEPWITNRELEYVSDAVGRGWISPKGEYVREFESEFAAFVGSEHALATSSGTSALHLSLVAAGIGPGDEVIVPDLTWIACANVVEYVGAEPVFADVTEDTFLLDPDAVRSALTTDTAAVMPVHLYGFPCHMDAILRIAKEHGLFVVEDAAEAHGAAYRGEHVGSLGDVGCFSFYGNKILTTGQGGMITTDDDEIAERIRLYRRDGMSRSRKYFHEVVGFNYRMTNMQGAVGVAQLERAEEILDAKRRVAAEYRDRLADTPVRFQTEREWATPSYWMNAPLFESSEDRDAVVTALEDADVETRPFFYPLHDNPPYRRRQSRHLPVSMDLYDRGLNLPSGPLLESGDVARICDVVRGALE